MIATAHYENKAYCTYVDSLVKSKDVLHELGIKHFWQSVMGDSYVERAKNSILGLFLDSRATHLLMIDSDMSWDIEGFIKILSTDRNFVAGAYPCKNNWDDYGVKIIGNPDEDGLYEVEYAPGGFYSLSKTCVKTMWDAAIKQGECYTDISAAYKKLTADLFQRRVVNGCKQGEDVTFCEIWRILGGKIYLEPNIRFGHSGIKEYMGCFADKIKVCDK